MILGSDYQADMCQIYLYRITSLYSDTLQYSPDTFWINHTGVHERCLTLNSLRASTSGLARNLKPISCTIAKYAKILAYQHHNVQKLTFVNRS